MAHNKHRFELPGKWLSGSITFGYLLVLLLVPLLFTLWHLVHADPQSIRNTLLNPRTFHAFRITILTSLFAAVINLVIGILIAWVQARYRYPGKGLVNMLIDLPLTLPTAVTGIAMVTLFSDMSYVGRALQSIGIQVSYTPLGIIVALVFIGLPFVVRQVEPILEELGAEQEEAAQLLGASPFQVFCKIIFPTILPGALVGFTTAFARGLGEYGSVIFVSGNIPMKTEVVSLLIVSKLEQFDYTGAVVLATAALIVSFGLLWISNRLQAWHRRRVGMTL